MIVLMIGTTAMVAVGIGWYGHKASLRIAYWGLRVNEQDLIFQRLSQGEGEGELWSASKQRIKVATIGATVGNSNYPSAAAALK